MDRETTRNRNLLLGVTAAAVILAEVIAVLIIDFSSAAGNESPIAGDPGLYHDIVTALFAGDIPYVDYAVEHLPGALVPMVAVKIASNVFGLSFLVLWPVAMGVLFMATVVLADRMPAPFSAGRRFLLLTLPLLPLVLFRIEPWLMFWVVASIVLAFRESWPMQSLTAFIAAIIKGWPIVLFIFPFRRSHRTIAIASAVCATLAVVAVGTLPGFQQGRAFEGIHVETFVGSLLLVVRGITGADLQVIATAGATYTGAPVLAVVVNGLIGLPFLILAVVLMFRTTDVTRLVRLVGLGVLGIVLASPLLSAQFVYWLVPFAVLLIAGLQRTFVAAAALTLATIALWDPFSTLWSTAVLSRNALLLLLAVGWALSAITEERDTAEEDALDHVA